MTRWILFLALSATLRLQAQIDPPKATPAARESDIDAADDPAGDPDSGLDRPEERWHYFYDQRVYPGTQFPEGARLRAFRQLKQLEQSLREGRFSLRSAADVQAQWKLIGPRPILYLPGYVTSGRVTGIAVDPRNKDVVFIGTADGGVWKTTDGGNNWTPLTDDQPALAIGAVTLDPSKPDTIYAGTGEENFNSDAYSGAGILKSEDGGATWANIVGPFSRQRIGALAVHSTKGNIVMAATNVALYRSTDGGQSWDSVLSGAATSVFFDPSQPDVAWVALGNINGSAQNGVYRSSDAGASWTRSPGLAPSLLPSGTNVGRIEVVPAPTSPDTVYAAIANRVSGPGASLLGLYRTIDGGAHWTRLPSVPDFCNPQCWYDLVIRPHPGNPNIVFAGGVNLVRSIDGGSTWTRLTTPAVPSGGPHDDQHALAFTVDGSRFYDGNDGGIWSSDNFSQGTVVWNNLNNTLAITQYYPSLSIHPTDPSIGLAGAQDNGTHLYQNSRWIRVIGGDGGSTAIDPASPSTAYGSYVHINLYRTNRLDFNDQIPIIHGINQDDRSRFISPWTLDPSSPLRLYYGTYRVYRSVDGGGLWKAISPDLTNAPDNTSSSSQTYLISTIAIAPGNPKIIYTGSLSGAVYVSEDGGGSWQDVSAGLPTRAITHVTVDPFDPGTVYVTLSGFVPDGATTDTGHVYRSRDYGQSWSDASANLPNLPVNDLVVDPDIPDTIYIGTDLGAMVTSNAGASWAPLGTGLPKSAVTSLILHRPSRTLRAATHGRSIWDLALPAGSGAPPSIDALTPPTKNAGDPAFLLSITGKNLGFGMHVFWNGEERHVTQAEAGALQVEIPASDLAGAGRAAITVFNSSRGGGQSLPAKFPIGPAPAVANGGAVSSAASTIATAAPGSLVSVYGANLAGGVVQAVEFPLPQTLGGATVAISGRAAPIYFVAPKQINVQMPFEARPGNFALTVDLAGTTSATSTITVADTAPALFSLAQTGAGQGAIRIAGTAIIAAPPALGFGTSRPAHIAEAIEIYCTGLGVVSNSPGTGNAASTSTLSTTRLTPTVTIGGVPAAVEFSGLAPGSAGLYQVNVKIPDGVPTGEAVPIVLTIGGVTSNSVTVAIQ